MFPKKLKIGGHEYSVKFHPEGKTCKDEADMGITDATDNSITISNNVTQSQKEATLIHEILHVINSTMDHDLLASLSEQIYQVLKDNKLLNL